MKITKYIAISFLYIFSIYFLSNWIVWNTGILWFLLGLPFIMGLCAIWTVGVVATFRKPFLISLFVFIAILSFSYLIFIKSIDIGKWQVQNELKTLKSKIDKYHSDKGFYPVKMADLKKEEYIDDFKKPIFLIFTGKYHYTLDSNHNFYGLSIGTEFGDWSYTVNKDNRIFFEDND